MSHEDEEVPLLREDRQAQRDAGHDQIHHRTLRFPLGGEDSYIYTTRTQTQRLLTSKFGHYAVLLLVSLDVSCIFADFLISLYVCEHSCGKDEGLNKDLERAQGALGMVSLAFSCLFMVELLASVWAFGLQYGVKFKISLLATYTNIVQDIFNQSSIASTPLLFLQGLLWTSV